MTRPSNIPPKNNPKDEQDRQAQLQRQMRNGIGYVLAGLIALWLFQQFILTPLAIRATEIPYSEFRQKITAGQLVKVTIGNTYITGEMKNPTPNATPATIPRPTRARTSAPTASAPSPPRAARARLGRAARSWGSGRGS